MSSESVSFEGQFTIWTYDVTHGRLLICRNPHDEFRDRIEVLFYDVMVMELCSYFDSLKIEKLTKPTPETSKLFFAIEAEQPGINLFKITTKNWTGTIAAAGFKTGVNNGNRASPSAIYKPGPVVKRLAMNGYLLD